MRPARALVVAVLAVLVAVAGVVVAQRAAPEPVDAPSADEVLAAFALDGWVPEPSVKSGDAIVLQIGPHELVLGETTTLDAAVNRATVEPGTPAPRWAALASCDGPHVDVYAFSTGERLVRYEGRALPADAESALGCW